MPKQQLANHARTQASNEEATHLHKFQERYLQRFANSTMHGLHVASGRPSNAKLGSVIKSKQGSTVITCGHVGGVVQ
eukprot:2488751-Amphidinium_carterae.1